jgi:hypothetical protein
MGVTAPKTISEIIDRLDMMREELLTLQRSLEKTEIVEDVLSITEAKLIATPRRTLR